MTSFQGTLPGNPTQMSPTGAADPFVPTNSGLPGRITMSTPATKLMAPVRHQCLVYADDHAAVYRTI